MKRPENIYETVPGFSVADAFERGDYTYVADQAEEGDWRRYASRGLMGLAEEALRGLSRFQGEEPRFYEAVALWIVGHDDAAERRLVGLSLPHAQGLIALLRKPIIDVLVQLPWAAKGPQAILQHIGKDPRFSVRNIGPARGDLPIRPYASIWDYADQNHPPDFYFCQMVEWHLIPPDIQTLPCPILGQTSDFDIHVQTVHPWLKLFDELIVTDHTDWRDLERMVDCPVATFPKTFGVEPSRYWTLDLNRNIDCAVTGTLFQAWHPDKASLIAEVIFNSKLLTVVDGFAPVDIYQLYLSTSKVGIAYFRRGAGTLTRALDTIAAGCAVVVQRGNVLRFYYGEAEGVYPYDTDGRSLVTVLEDLVRRWPEVSRQAARGAARVQKEFALSRAASQFFRFLTFVAARPGRKRLRVDTSTYVQERVVMRLGWLPPGGAPAHIALAAENYKRLASLFRATGDPRYLNASCREIVMYIAGYVGLHEGKFGDIITSSVLDVNLKNGQIRQLLDPVLNDLANAVRQFPDNLIFVFNHLRVALHLGTFAQVAVAVSHARSALVRPEREWLLAKHEDVYSWDIFSDFFNYRSYHDHLTSEYTGGPGRVAERVALIIASIHHYLGVHNGDREALRAAVEFDPVFPSYRYSLARSLSRGDSQEEWSECIRLLLALRSSTSLEPAFELLQQMVALDRLPRESDMATEVRSLLRAWILQKVNFNHQPPAGRLRG